MPMNLLVSRFVSIQISRYRNAVCKTVKIVMCSLCMCQYESAKE